MNEERYASRVRLALNHGLKDIPAPTARRLEAARHLALSRQKQPQAQLTLASGLRLPGFSTGTHLPYLKQALAVVALLLGMWLSFYWHSVQYVNELEEVDSALLADDLPPEAFMDDELFKWLKDDSSPD